jgi:hypothetical protein
MKFAILALCATAAFAGGVDDLHAPWNGVLGKIVQGNRVDYALAKADIGTIDAYLKSLETIDAAAFKSASALQQHATWVNAFNAGVVQMIATNPGFKSIADIPGWNDSARFNVAGRPVSLRDIQDSLLLLPTKDARYWFVLTNGSLMSAPLASSAYTGDNLEAALTDRTKSFFADTTRLKVSPKETHLQATFNYLRVKPYFKKAKGGVDFVDFLDKYAPSGASKGTLVFDIVENYAKNAILPPPPAAKGKKGKKK